MLTNDQLLEFDKEGFIKGDIVLNDEEVDELRSELDLVMEGKTVRKPVLNRNLLGNDYGTTQTQNEVVVQIVNIWMSSDAFLRHAGNPKICEEVAQLCRADQLRIWHDQIQYKPPVTGGPTGWHQDHPAWPVIQPASLVSAWVALDDATIENGCMWMVPGSHLWGNHQQYMASNEEFMPYHKEPQLLPAQAKVEAVPFEIKKGQVGYHHCMTWHGSPKNKSDKKRRAIAVHYMPNNVYFAPEGSHPMEKHITVKPGEIVAGEGFPVVYNKSLN